MFHTARNTVEIVQPYNPVTNLRLHKLEYALSERPMSKSLSRQELICFEYLSFSTGEQPKLILHTGQQPNSSSDIFS